MKLNNVELKKLIEGNPIALATVGKDGKPNVIAVAHAKVIDSSKLLITDNYMAQTLENLKSNNNVCLAIWDKKWEGYKLIGTAEYFDSGKWKEFVQKMSVNKNLPAKGAILVKINKVIKLK